jgi:hypothetical protein
MLSQILWVPEPPRKLPYADFTTDLMGLRWCEKRNGVVESARTMVHVLRTGVIPAKTG